MASIPYFTCPSLLPFCLWKWGARFGKGLESGQGSKLQLKGIPCFFFWVQLFVRGNKQGLGAISVHSVGFGVKGAIITLSGYGSEQAVAWWGRTQVKAKQILW